MKVAVSALGPSLESQFDERFGRCPYLVIVDSETDEALGLENPGARSDGGAGVAAAQTVVQHHAEAVITGHLGPHAANALSSAGIPAYSHSGGSVLDALKKFRSGELEKCAPSAGRAGRGRG